MKDSQKGKHFAHKFEMLLDAFQQIIENQSNTQKRTFYIDLAKKQLIDLYEELIELEKEIPQEIPFSASAKVTREDEIVQLHHVSSYDEKSSLSESTGTKEQTSQSLPAEDVSVQPFSQALTSNISEVVQDDPVDIQVTQKSTDDAVAGRVSTGKEQRVLAETLGQGRTSLIDQFSDKSSENLLVNKLHKTPIYDLKKSIGLNDRFTFINDLFQGNAVEFDKFINELQNMTNGQQIFLLFNSKAEALQWEGKESFRHFQDIVSRYALSKQ